MEREVGPRDLDGTVDDVAARSVRGTEPPDVHGREIEFGFSLSDPAGYLLSDRRCEGDAMRTEPSGHPETGHVGLPEDELAVWRERVGAVDHRGDPRVRDDRQPTDRPRHDLLEARPVRREQPRVEVIGDAAEPPRDGVSLESSDHEAVRFRSEVAQVVRVSN